MDQTIYIALEGRSAMIGITETSEAAYRIQNLLVKSWKYYNTSMVKLKVRSTPF